jgi:hypothetical protein
MPLTAEMEPKAPEKKEWPLIPEDVYQVEITDLTGEESEWKGEKKDVYKFEFTLIEDGPYYGRKLWKKGARVMPFPSSTGKPPLTWKVASAVAKHPLTEDEGKTYTVAHLNALIGKQLRIGVMVTPPKDGKQYNNAESFLMAKTQLPPFDESKVKKDEPVKPAQSQSPAAIVEQAFHEDHEDVEFGGVEVEDIPY